MTLYALRCSGSPSRWSPTDGVPTATRPGVSGGIAGGVTTIREPLSVLLSTWRVAAHLRRASEDTTDLAAASNRMKDLLPLVSELLQVVETVRPGEATHIGRAPGRRDESDQGV